MLVSLHDQHCKSTHNSFCKTFFQYKILKAFVKLNGGSIVQIQLTHKELSWPSKFRQTLYLLKYLVSALNYLLCELFAFRLVKEKKIISSTNMFSFKHFCSRYSSINCLVSGNSTDTSFSASFAISNFHSSIFVYFCFTCKCTRTQPEIF